MSEIDKDILIGFVEESKAVLDECVGILEKIEGDPDQAVSLTDYANRIDRLLGGAKSVAQMAPNNADLNLIGDCAGLCKAMGYRGAQTGKNPALFDVIVSFLLDATEIVGELINAMTNKNAPRREHLQKILIERVQWINDVSARTPAAQTVGQSEIDEILKKLGMG